MSRQKRGSGLAGADVAAVVDSWEPQAWARDDPAALQQVLPVARRCVAQAEPSSPRHARRLLWATTGALLWGRRELGTADASVVLHPHNVNRWVMVENKGQDRGWRSNALAALERVGRAVNHQAWPAERAKLGRPPRPVPYDAVEEELIRQTAAMPGKPNLCQRLAVAFAACGAGMSGPQINACRPDDLVPLDHLGELGSGRIGVRVRGRSPRLVPIRDAYTKTALMAVEASGGDAFFPSTNKNTSYQAAKWFVTRDGDGLSLPRARASWLCAHLRAGTPLGALHEIAGPLSADTLNWLIGHISSEMDPETAAKQALRP